MNWKRMPDKAIMEEIGQRRRKKRLQKNYTQEALAEIAGIHVNTYKNLEYGKDTTLKTLIQVLRGLKLLDDLDKFLSDTGPSPLEMLKMQGKQRKRAS